MVTFFAVLLALIAYDGIKLLCSPAFWHGVKGGWRRAREPEVFHGNTRAIPLDRNAADAIVAAAMKGMHS